MHTVLHSEHVKLNAHIVDFHGWNMPLWYESIMKEHEAVRNNAGMFDVSHMGRILFKGKDSEVFLDCVLSTNVKKLQVWDAKYCFILNENGGIKDDCILYKFPDKYLLVVNASNREKVLEHFQIHIKKFNLEMKDVSKSLALVAVQGPDAEKIVPKLTESPIQTLKYYKFLQGKFMKFDALIARTGYTGENGYELFINSKDIQTCWAELIKQVQPCGLGARDSLRLEAGMPLYGNELGEDSNPLELGLHFAVSLDKESFIGLKALKSRQIGQRLTGFAAVNQKIPRGGNDICTKAGKVIGKATSGTYSPTFERGLGIAIIENGFPIHESIYFKQKEELIEAKQVELPFYSKTRKTPIKREL
ncbi:MAG: glycine cleavage system aminomethyltransferase GcvT [Planctomycetes bacterium]|nr:glycine cleavage system aminomethyltransferase GcvT [Planctomycetota bacterium]